MGLVPRLPGLRHHVDRYGRRRGLQQWLAKLYLRKLRYRTYPSDSVFAYDWDVLVVLDACRVDLLEEVQGEYPFIRNVGTRHSPGSTTWEWLDATFGTVSPELLAGTAYISANPHTHRLDPDRLGLLDEVWRYAWDDDLGTVPPRPVTDRGIAVARSGVHDRVILHYLQPHVPFVRSSASPALDLGNFRGPEVTVADDWHRLARGERDRKTVWSAYRENLRYVLEDVAILVENVDATPLVITADHGNAAGEYGLFGHPENVPLPALRNVPWCPVRATDRGGHTPAPYNRTGR